MIIDRKSPTAFTMLEEKEPVIRLDELVVVA